MNIVDLHFYRQAKIKEMREEENRLMVEARHLIDDAIDEDGYNFSKLGTALALIDTAVILHNKIKSLEVKCRNLIDGYQAL